MARATRPRLSNPKGLPVQKKVAHSRAPSPVPPVSTPPIKNEWRVVRSRTGMGCQSGGYRGVL